MQKAEGAEVAKKLEYEKLKYFVEVTPVKIRDAEAKRTQLLAYASGERSKTRMKTNITRGKNGKVFHTFEQVKDKSGYAKAKKYEREAEELAEQIKRDTALLAKAKERLAVISK